MKSFIHIGAAKEAVVEGRKAIMEILLADADQPTIIKALEVLSSMCSVHGVTIRDCMIEGKL